MTAVVLTSRYKDALTFAFDLHRSQARKASQVAYFSHLMAVSALVLEDGGSEDEAIAALLHDAVEDQGGEGILARIGELYGPRVAAIVAACSDSLVDCRSQAKAPWRERKQAYLEHLRDIDPPSLRVSLADKIHNARTIVSDLQAGGETVWERFTGGREGSLWYYQSLVEIYRGRLGDQAPRVRELAGLVERMAAS